MTELVNQPSALPTRKVTFMGAAMIASSIAADVLVGFLPETMPVDPSEVEQAFMIVVTLLVGYFTRDRANA